MLSDAIVRERRAFAETLRVVGPGAPTLLDGWTAHDVAAHVVSLDRFAGALTFLGRRIVTRGVRLNDAARRFADQGLRSTKRRGFPWALDQLAKGPPRLLLRPSVAAVGLFETFVHHEDVRRPHTPATDRAAPSEIVEAIPWLLRYHRRRLPEDVELLVRTPVGEWRQGAGRTAVLDGPDGEVVLWLAGRSSATAAELRGEAAPDLRAVRLEI